MEKAEWKHPLMDFESHSRETCTACKELAQKLFEPIPELSLKSTNWTKIQQGKQRWDESVLEYYERLGKKSFKHYSGLTPESFSTHQNNSLLNSPFKEGLDENLILVKRHKLGWSMLHTNNPFVILAN